MRRTRVSPHPPPHHQPQPSYPRSSPSPPHLMSLCFPPVRGANPEAALSRSDMHGDVIGWDAPRGQRARRFGARRRFGQRWKSLWGVCLGSVDAGRRTGRGRGLDDGVAQGQRHVKGPVYTGSTCQRSSIKRGPRLPLAKRALPLQCSNVHPGLYGAVEMAIWRCRAHAPDPPGRIA